MHRSPSATLRPRRFGGRSGRRGSLAVLTADHEGYAAFCEKYLESKLRQVTWCPEFPGASRRAALRPEPLPCYFAISTFTGNAAEVSTIFPNPSPRSLAPSGFGEAADVSVATIS